MKIHVKDIFKESFFKCKFFYVFIYNQIINVSYKNRI